MCPYLRWFQVHTEKESVIVKSMDLKGIPLSS